MSASGDPFETQRDLLADPSALPALLADVLIAIALTRDDNPTPHQVARDALNHFGWTEEVWRSTVEPHVREKLGLDSAGGAGVVSDR